MHVGGQASSACRLAALAACDTAGWNLRYFKGCWTSRAKTVTVQIDKVDDKVSDEDRAKSCAEDLRCCATSKGLLDVAG